MYDRVHTGACGGRNRQPENRGQDENGALCGNSGPHLSEETYRANLDWYREEISKCTYRQFTTGFYFGKPSEEAQIYDNNTYINEYTYLGIVSGLDQGCACIEQRNKFSVGDTIEIMKPDGSNVETQVEQILDEEGAAMPSAPHPKQRLRLKLSVLPSPYDILRVKTQENS